MGNIDSKKLIVKFLDRKLKISVPEAAKITKLSKYMASNVLEEMRIKDKLLNFGYDYELEKVYSFRKDFGVEQRNLLEEMRR